VEKEYQQDGTPRAKIEQHSLKLEKSPRYRTSWGENNHSNASPVVK